LTPATPSRPPARRAPERLDVARAPLAGAGTIEASAGTGKTHTITRLYLRLVVERAIPVERLLVVTYTVAATEELRTRIRSELATARARLASGSLGDEVLAEAVRRAGAGPALERVASALRGFDEAAIFTIHGFCQRVLAEKAFESGMPFDTELVPDESEMLEEIAQDFWRTRVYDAPPLLIARLLARGETPSTLLESVRSFVGKPYLRCIGVPAVDAADVRRLEADLADAHARARDLWLDEHEAVRRLVSDPVRLNQQSYAPSKIATCLRDVAAALESDRPVGDLPPALTRLTPAALEKGTKRGQSTPVHPFFDACGQLVALAEALSTAHAAAVQRLRADLLDSFRRELALRKQRLRTRSYDDLLLDLAAALERDRDGRLAAAIRDRYRAALIDEFQDTDPIQYRIFRDVYGGSDLPVFFVGDPKQAIYSFRGADIFAYLDACDDSARRYRLETNWRSDPGLVTAVNAIFSRAPRPLLFDAIGFQPTVPAERDRERLEIAGDPEEPFRLVLVPRDAPGSAPGERASPSNGTRPLPKGRAREIVARATACEVARLLGLAERGHARIGDRALSGGDIAVLVRTNDEAKLVRRELLRLRVPSVEQAMESVFATREAQELERVLRAIAAPGDESLVRAALATELVGASGADLHRMQEPGHEAEWEDRAERMRAYHARWSGFGFVRMFREMLDAEGVARRLLPYADGDRRLTNLVHLGELLADAEERGRLGMESLVRWLVDRRRSAAARRHETVEEQQLRLESDDELVKIVTVHKSKGLQYEIVLCPFLWDGRVYSLDSETRDRPFLFHDPEDGAAVLDLGSEDREELRRHAVREEVAEKLRLLYVALTRARHRCVLYWGAINEAGTSAPAWLLHRGALPDGATIDDVARRFQTLSDADLAADVRALVDAAAGTILLEGLPAPTASAPERPRSTGPPLRARSLARPVREGFRIASFSLLHGLGDGGLALDADAPDHDASGAAVRPELTLPGAATIFDFPRGLRAGRCLHEVFEELDFRAVADGSPGERMAAIAPVVERALAAHRLDAGWRDAVAAAVDRALIARLDPAGQVRLAGLAPASCARELEFYYPVADLSDVALRRALLDHGVAGGRFDREIAALSFGRIRGFMKGFVDLVFESGGRYYVLDYKSNHLGGSSDDYDGDRVAVAMARGGYFLQYLIYVLTLHRLLALRLPGYDPAQHLGGVFYAFVRGMDPDAAPGWAVFHDRPSPDLVAALDQLVARGRDGAASGGEAVARRAGARRARRNDPAEGA